MKISSALPTLSLRVKLILSYLLVALGAILILTIVVSLAVQSYFVNWQRDQLRTQTEDFAQKIGHLYRAYGGSWENVPFQTIQTNGPVLLVITDATGGQIYFSRPAYLLVSDSDKPVLTQALGQALQGQEAEGQL